MGQLSLTTILPPLPHKDDYQPALHRVEGKIDKEQVATMVAACCHVITTHLEEEGGRGTFDQLIQVKAGINRVVRGCGERHRTRCSRVH